MNKYDNKTIRTQIIELEFNLRHKSTKWDIDECFNLDQIKGTIINKVEEMDVMANIKISNVEIEGLKNCPTTTTTKATTTKATTTQTFTQKPVSHTVVNINNPDMEEFTNFYPNFESFTTNMNTMTIKLTINATIEQAYRLANQFNTNKLNHKHDFTDGDGNIILFRLEKAVQTIPKSNTLEQSQQQPINYVPRYRKDPSYESRNSYSNSYNYRNSNSYNSSPSPRTSPRNSNSNSSNYSSRGNIPSTTISPGINKIHKENNDVLKKILESLNILKPETLDTSRYNSLKPRLNKLDSLDTSKLLGLLTSTLDLHLDDNNYNNVTDIVSYIKKLVSSKSNLNRYNTNEDEILSKELKRALQNRTIKKLSRTDRELLLSTPDSQLWRQILYLNEKYKNKNKYNTPYVPGYSYMPPKNWETKRKEIPKCINDTKQVSNPAFVFDSGVPSNALEIEGPGAGQVGSMLPKFSYMEDSSGIYTDNEQFNKDHTNTVIENTDNHILLDPSKTKESVENLRKKHSSNHRFNNYTNF